MIQHSTTMPKYPDTYIGRSDAKVSQGEGELVGLMEHNIDLPGCPISVDHRDTRRNLSSVRE